MKFEWKCWKNRALWKSSGRSSKLETTFWNPAQYVACDARSHCPTSEAQTSRRQLPFPSPSSDLRVLHVQAKVGRRNWPNRAGLLMSKFEIAWQLQRNFVEMCQASELDADGYCYRTHTSYHRMTWLQSWAGQRNLKKKQVAALVFAKCDSCFFIEDPFTEWKDDDKVGWASQLIIAINHTRHPIDGLVQQLEIDSGPACMQACFFRASVRICKCWLDSRPAFCQASKRAPVCPSAVLHWSRLNDSNIARTSHSRSSWSRWNPTIHSQCGAKGCLDTTRTL